MEVILSAEEAIKEGELSSFSEKINKDMPSSDDMIERYSQKLGSVSTCSDFSRDGGLLLLNK